MAHLAQIGAAFHGRGKPLRRCVRRTVVDVDDFVIPAAIERRSDLGDHRSDIFGLVAHGNNDGNGDGGYVRGRQISPVGVGRNRPTVASYGADAPAATPLRGPSATGKMTPPSPIANPRPRAANQYRTPMAPIIPIVAPATTSLG